MNILHEDNHLIIVEKRAGELVHSDKTGDDTLSGKVKSYIKHKYNKPGDVFLGVTHRLDRPVSGVIAFARTSKALRRLNELFRDRKVTKRYVAIVEGLVTEASGTLEDYLVKNHEKNISRVVPKSNKKSKYARLHFRRIAIIAGKSLLSISLDTGRSHQIRAQLAHMGYPILGDLKYGANETLVDRSIALHCTELAFEHPVRKIPLCIRSRFPKVGIWNEFKNFER